MVGPAVLLASVSLSAAAILILLVAAGWLTKDVFSAGLVLVVVIFVASAVILFAVWRVANEVVRILQVEVARQTGGLVALGRVASLRSLAPLGDSSLSPAAAGRLVSLVRDYEPHTIVELGAGSSTLLLSATCDQLAMDTEIHSLEHDDRFLDMVRRQVGDDRGVQLHHRPLVAVGDEMTWYEIADFGEYVQSIDLLVVDGPPDVQGRGHRAHAMEALSGLLSPGAMILVDDTDRRTERSMITSWQSTYPNLSLELEGRDFVVLRYA